MLIINNELFNQNNIYNFIEWSVNKLISISPGIKATKEYWLFYYIKDDFCNNLSSLCNRDISIDFLGFPQIKKNTRHAIEAFIDLNNLISDNEYITVLEYCSKQGKYSSKYNEYLYKGQFTIQSKFNIANELYGKNFNQDLMETCKGSNNYVHPNVFVKVIDQNDTETKKKILKELLNINLFLLKEAYSLMLKKFSNSNQPLLGCYGCNNYNCYNCYSGAIHRFRYIIDNNLISEVYSNYYNFQ